MIPRELAGPFIILGVDKDADDATIESHYHSQLTSIERGECNWSPDDLEWARCQLSEAKSRLSADLESLNADLASGEIHRLARLYRLDGSPPGWEPIDPEPPAPLPNIEDIDPVTLAANVAMPEFGVEIPAIDTWLQQFAAAVTDPWTMELVG